MENKKNEEKKSIIDQAKWYIVTSITGNEDAVYKNIEDKVKAYQLEEVVQEMKLLKTKEITIEVFDNINNPPPKIMRNSKTITWETLPGNRYKKTRIREINRFPGYIYIKMIMMADAWYIIRNTYGVTGFVGSSGKGAQPIPMSDEEVENLFNPANNQDIIINKSEDFGHVEVTVDKPVTSEKKVEFLSQDNANFNDDGFFDSTIVNKPSSVEILGNVEIDSTPKDYLTNHEQIVETKVIDESQNTLSKGILDTDSKVSHKGFTVGNTVEILTGSWSGNEGEIISIDKTNDTATISVQLFGRNNETTISLNQIKKKI